MTGAERDARKYRKELQRLSDAVLVHLHLLDTKIGADPSVPREVGRRLASFANYLDMLNDGIRYTALSVDYRKDDKAKAVRKLMPELAASELEVNKS